VLVFVDLDDTSKGLAIHFRVVVDDHVNALVDRANTRAPHGLHIISTRLLQLDVLGSRNASLFKLTLAALLN